MNLAEIVHRSLNNAMENGYDLRCWSNWQIVEDLVWYEAQLEDVEPSTLLEHVKSWRKTLIR